MDVKKSLRQKPLISVAIAHHEAGGVRFTYTALTSWPALHSLP